MEGRKDHGSIFATKGLRALSYLAAVGRWQDSMAVLALLLSARDAGLSLAMATLCTAAMALATGLSSTFKARWIDQVGMKKPVSWLAGLTGCGYLLLIASLLLANFWLVLAAAFLLGAARTNSGMCMQVTWMGCLNDESMRAKAVSWESLVNAVMQNTGPLMVGALVALYSPLAALVFCGVATSASMFVWARHSFHQEKPEAAPRRRHSLNIGRPVMTVALAAMSLNILLGGLQVVLVSSSSALKATGLNAALACGAAAVGIYCLRRGFPALKQLHWMLVGGILSLAIIVPLAAQSGFVFCVLLLLVGGGVYGLGSSSITLMIQRRAPKGRRAEAFAWRLTLCFIGVSCGQATAGQMISSFGLSSASLIFGIAGALFAAVAAIALSADQSTRPIGTDRADQCARPVVIPPRQARLSR